MTEWDYIFERDWNKYSINAILERKKDERLLKKLAKEIAKEVKKELKQDD